MKVWATKGKASKARIKELKYEQNVLFSNIEGIKQIAFKVILDNYVKTHELSKNHLMCQCPLSFNEKYIASKLNPQSMFIVKSDGWWWGGGCFN